ncbi:Aldehyde/histidinol dehydrogenase [Melampsora americana]|nr:Aldehyde/histidinol dehydrogenase [Melampsora americana]
MTSNTNSINNHPNSTSTIKTNLVNTTANQIASSAKLAFDRFQSSSSESKNLALQSLKQTLSEHKEEVIQANQSDLQVAKGDQNTTQAILNRLDLLSSPSKYDQILDGIDDVIKLDDPVGIVQSIQKLDHDLELYKVTCPIGVLLIIFESRPEVIINITALAIKSGNAAILKGGKETSQTQKVITNLIHTSLVSSSLPPNLIQTVSSRSEISELLKEDQFIDLVIPRGSKQLVQNIKSNTSIPVLGHADGLCTIYVDEDAEIDTAIRCIIDAKTTYPAACNSVETVLVHRSHLTTNSRFTELILGLLNSKVTLKLDQSILDILNQSQSVTSHPLFWTNCSLSKPEDYQTEWLSLTLSIRTIESLQEAIDHINQFSSHHTDSIITRSEENSKKFCKEVNSSSVFVNSSTRFADGYRFGFGTEIGISTSKIHARGPVGLDGLVIYKFIMKSLAKSGHTTNEFGDQDHQKKYLHQSIQIDGSKVPY